MTNTPLPTPPMPWGPHGPPLHFTPTPTPKIDTSSPKACIVERGDFMYCGRRQMEGEFVFVDKHHAVAFYHPRDVKQKGALRCCGDCATIVEAILAQEGAYKNAL